MIAVTYLILDNDSPEPGNTRSTYLWDLMKQKSHIKKQRQERDSEDINKKKKELEKSDKRRLSQRIKDNIEDNSLKGQIKSAIKDYVSQ